MNMVDRLVEEGKLEVVHKRPPRRRTAYQKGIIALLSAWWAKPPKMRPRGLPPIGQEADPPPGKLWWPCVNFRGEAPNDPRLIVYWRGQPPYTHIKDRHTDIVLGVFLDYCEDLGLVCKQAQVKRVATIQRHMVVSWMTTLCVFIPPEENWRAPQKTRPADAPHDDGDHDVHSPDAAPAGGG